MISKTMIMPERKRVLAPPFAWIDRRFLFDGFLTALSPRENLLYFFLVLVADRNGLSFYSYDKICTMLKIDVDAYVQARDGLLRKQLVAFDGQRLQVLALPQSRPATTSESYLRESSQHRDTQSLREIFARLVQESTPASESPSSDEHVESVVRHS